MNGKEWTNAEKNYLEDFYYEKGPTECARFLGRSYWSVCRKANKLHLIAGRRRVSLSCNEAIYDEWTRENSYCFGLLVSDGNMLDKGSETGYRVEFCSKDKEQVVNFTACTGSKIYEKEQKSTGNRIFRVHLRGRRIWERLWELGLRPRKSNKESWPSLPSDEFYWHFVRGYFDGDGCVSYSRKCLVAVFDGGKEFLERMRIFLGKYDIRAGLVTPRKGTYRVGVNNRASLGQLYERMYEDSEGLRLSRKYKRFHDYFVSGVS